MKQILCAISAAALLSAIASPSAAENIRLVGHWSFDNDTPAEFKSANGAAPFKAGSKDDLTNVTFIDGIHGKAVHFDGSKKSVHVAGSQHDFQLQAPFTIACWVIKDKKVPERNDILTKYTGNKSGFEFSIMWEMLNYTFRCNNKEIVVRTPAKSFPINKWTHAAVTDDGKCIKLYLNGVLSAEKTYSETEKISWNNINAPLTVGKFPGSFQAYRLQGAIDELYIFSGVLSAEQLEVLAADNKIPENSEK